MTDPAADPLTVLYVDDEAQALKYFTRAVGKHFRVETFPSGEEALTWLREEPAAGCDIVVSDMRMPMMSGADFLARMRRDHPSSIRILTTAYADLDDAIRAVNEGEIFHYITKPWNLGELRATLQRAADHFRLRRERDRLLGQKFAVLQGVITIDRLRSLAVAVPLLESHLPGATAGLVQYCDAALVHRPPTMVEPSRDPGHLMQRHTEDLTAALRRFDAVLATRDRPRICLGELLAGPPWQLADDAPEPAPVDRVLLERSLADLAAAGAETTLQARATTLADGSWRLRLSASSGQLVYQAFSTALTGATAGNLGGLPLALAAAHHGGHLQAIAAEAPLDADPTTQPPPAPASFALALTLPSAPAPPLPEPTAGWLARVLDRLLD